MAKFNIISQFLKDFSFENPNVPELFFKQENTQAKLEINIDIQINKKLELAVCKRNNIIHNNRRENNGNDICISKTELLSLKKEIDNFLHKIREHFVSQNIDKLLSR